MSSESFELSARQR